MQGAVHLGLVQLDPLYRFVLLVQFALPPALNIGNATNHLLIWDKVLWHIFGPYHGIMVYILTPWIISRFLGSLWVVDATPFYDTCFITRCS